MNLVIWAVASILAAGPAAQSASNGAAASKPASEPQTTAEAPAVETEALPVSLDRIQRQLSKTPQIRPSEVTPVFRVEVLGKLPPIEVLLGPDYLVGKTPIVGAAMSHQEFRDMVTPPEFRGTAMFTQGEAITVMATAVALQWALQKAVQKYREAINERERESARREVQEALEELEKARAAAGLPKRAP
jgi:hypothetical protein